MTIVYNGNRANYNPNTHKTLRTATIYYNDEDNFDCQVVEYVVKDRKSTRLNSSH